MDWRESKVGMFVNTGRAKGNQKGKMVQLYFKSENKNI